MGSGRFKSTPLDGAAFWGWDKVVAYLLGKGADINAADSRGYTAVDYAMGRAGGNSRGGQRIDVHKDIADLLIAKGGKAGTPILQPQGGGRGGAPGAGRAGAAPGGGGRAGAPPAGAAGR